MKRHKTTSRRAETVTLALLLAIGMVALGLPAAAATGYSIDIPIDTIKRGPEGSVIELDSRTVPAEFQGQVCSAAAASNNDSVHPDNDLLVASAGTSVTIPDVERTSEQITIPAEGTFILGSEVVVSLLMGPYGLFSAGITVEIDCEPTEPPAGNIIVRKVVTEGSDTDQSFAFTASYDGDGFSLADGDSNDSGGLDAGTYTVSESLPDGWELVGATCDDQSPPDAIDLEAGETVTCTFTNNQLPPTPESAEIIVEKVVLGDANPFEFNFSTVGFDLADNTLAGGESSSSGPLAPGTGYAVSEDLPDGWTLVSAGCDDGSAPDAIELSPGETVTCTFTNQIEDDVLALVLVTVDAACVDEDTGEIDVTMSIPGGAVVEVRDSEGTLVGTFTDDGSIEVMDDAGYTWSAMPTEGNEFPSDFDASGTISVDECVEELPFTGVEGDTLAIVGFILLSCGLVVLRSQRTRKGS